MIEMDQLAQNRQKVTGEKKAVWLQAIESASQTDSIGRLTDGEFIALVEGCDKVVQYQLIVDLLEDYKSNQQNEKDGFDLLVNYVDQSNFSLSQWVTAIELFQNWVTEKSDTADMIKTLGYIQCCAQSVEFHSAELSSVVLDMLNQHGLQK